MPDLRNYVIVVLMVIAVSLGLVAMQFRVREMAAATRYDKLAAKVEVTNKEAADLLATRTAERDALQARLNVRASAQEKTDAIAKSKIAADSARAAPVRVRIDASSCGRDTPSDSSSTPIARDPGAGTASGVLAPAAQQLFAGDVDAVETLQAAYNSCKAALEW